eukprot:TRINITY_DN16055_c0_g1_i1.p1 TRINITY_DN16055_c0_g1~~TRINITY_DN16055_c0_g1_i1.p1  ORF type:complete len:310 (-),score=111.67 TRINITY_DN16055_c0_g1_i1:56-985(-)
MRQRMRVCGSTLFAVALLALSVHASVGEGTPTETFFEALQGTWVGSKGFNIVALPSNGSTPNDEGEFMLIVQPYTETLTFANAGAPALNRGGNVDQYVKALTYEQRVSERDTNALLHMEEGMFLNVEEMRDSTGAPLPPPEFSVARSGTIPHGDSIMLLGAPPTAVPGPPAFPSVSSLPTQKGPDAPADYNNLYMNSTVPGINVAHPSETLVQQLKEMQRDGVVVEESMSLAMSSANGGGILNIPFIEQRADATVMEAYFFLEKMRDTSGHVFDQLQYIQMINLEFHRSFGGNQLIGWPHVTINTLVKQ